MKKLCFALTAIICLTLVCGGCTGVIGAKGEVSQELIALSENAQYLPAREMLVADKSARVVNASYTARRQQASPEMLVEGGFSEDEYEALIENISPIDTPYNREFTVSDAKKEIIKVLSSGVVFDEWFSFESGELAGQGKYYVTNKNGILTVTRCSSFQPWIYDSATNKFLDNDDFTSNIPNYPVRSDSYLKISIYTEGDKQVVECEVAENLSYYNKVTPISYQIMRNVKDTSFTKIQVVMRNLIPDPEESGGWGYDIDTDLPYGYVRNFTQLDYSGPDDIKWLQATQRLPYAFDLSARNNVTYGCRSDLGGFGYRFADVLSEGEFGYTPSDKYLTVTPVISYLDSTAEFGDEYYSKYLWTEDNEEHYSGSLIAAEEQAVLNAQVSSVLDSLISLAGKSCGILTYDCTAENTTFEGLFDSYFNTVAKSAIDKSNLAKNYLSNDVYGIRQQVIKPL